MLLAPLCAQEAPANLARLVAHRETETETERNEYTYRQTVTLDELDKNGGVRGSYREVRDVIFSPTRERTEEFVGKPQNGLKLLTLTPEDFRDIRDIQPLTLTEERLWNYETRFKGEETMDEVDCWVLQVRPRQILEGQRFFDGLIWVDKKEYNIVRMEGQAVPQITIPKGKPVPPVHHHPQTHRWQALVSHLHLRRRHPAIPHRPAARAPADLIQRVQAVWGGIDVQAEGMNVVVGSGFQPAAGLLAGVLRAVALQRRSHSDAPKTLYNGIANGCPPFSMCRVVAWREQFGGDRAE